MLRYIAAMPDKTQVIAALQAALGQRLHSIEQVGAMARDEASSEETRSEGKYDTRATEASYLARGQAERAAQLRELIAWLARLGGEGRDTVGLAALVHLEGARTQWVFVAPSGGVSAEIEGVEVQLVSPSSPMGAAMLNLEAGDAFEVDSPQDTVEYEIVSVC